MSLYVASLIQSINKEQIIRARGTWGVPGEGYDLSGSTEGQRVRMFDFAGGYFKPAPVPGTAGSKKTASSWMRGGLKTYRNTKRLFDLVLCVLVLPATILAGLILLILNPFYNRGSLFFLQERMGRNNVPFTIVKFRTDFANRTGVVETISLVREDGAWKVAGIYVS